MHDWNDVERMKSSDENVSKYVFTKEDAVAEAVLYKYPTYEERTVICCSTQSGCPIGCTFCGAGKNFVRSLTCNEITSQVKHILKDIDVDSNDIESFQIMFMSMGEPMLNMKNLIVSIEMLNCLHPEAKLLVSTSGPKVDYWPFIELSEQIENVGLQFSIHESTNENRNLLIPFKAKLSLDTIAIVGEEWNQATGRMPFINYCVHENNASQEDVDRLVELFNPKVFQATLSVICEKDEGVDQSIQRQEEMTSTFRDKMSAVGYLTRVFNPAGQDDIGGGCGQLWYVQDWMKQNPELARPSIGAVNA